MHMSIPRLVTPLLILLIVRAQDPAHFANVANPARIAQAHLANILTNLDSEVLLEDLSQWGNLTDGLDCLAELTALYNGLNSSDPTTSIYFYDALGKPGSGVLTGNLMMLGDYDTCQNMKTASKSYFDHCKSTASVMFVGSPTPLPLTWTACLPAACQGPAFDVVINEVLPLIPQLSHYLKVSGVKTQCIVDFEYDAGAYIAVVVCGIFLFLALAGSLWAPINSFVQSIRAGDPGLLVNGDNEAARAAAEGIEPWQSNTDHVVNGHVRLSNSDSQGTARSMKKQQGEGQPESILGRILQSFSLQKSVPALLSTDTKEGQIHCLNGIRFMSINWVVLGHTYYIGLTASGDPSYVYKLFQRKSFLLVTNALPSVDSFFVLSGFLVSYLLLKDLARHNGKFRFLGYYLHRYIRLTIPFGIVMLIEGWLYPIYITGNFSEAFTMEHETCKKYWWTNLLYINNLYPWNTPEVCVGQSWYLSNDMQFFCLAPLFVFALWKSPIIGNVLSQCVIWASAIAAAVLTYYYGFGPTVIIDEKNPHNFRYLYTAPWIRCTPYLVGIIAGWIYWCWSDVMIDWAKRQKAWKKLGYGVAIWTSTIAVQYLIVFGLHDLLIHPEDNTTAKSVSYESLARIGWSIALTLQIFACQAGLSGWINYCLSWKGFLPFSRLTYGVYLLHFGIITALLTQLRHPFYFQPDFEVIIIYLGILAVSYGASALLYLFVEQPIMFLERISYRKSS